MNFYIIRKKAVTLTILSLVYSQSFAQFEIKQSTINSGGAVMTGGSYELNASIAQVDASKTLSNGAYSLQGGFWHEDSNFNTNSDLVFNNGFE